MKTKYQTPEIEVIEIALEDSVLQNSQLESMDSGSEFGL